MACGLPVVTTNAGGIPYIVTHEETAMLVEINDHEGMAAAAIRLLEDNELAVGIAQRARVAARKFTWESVRDDWLQVYFELGRKGVLADGLNGLTMMRAKEESEGQTLNV